jgi:hypothetical protein
MDRARLIKRPTAVLATPLALLALAVGAQAAQAEPWGHLNSFALSEATQINESSHVRFAAGSDGVYYLLREEAHTGEFILQRFHEGTLQASASFKRPPEEEETSKVGSEGVDAILAVDPARGRVYVLFVYERRSQNEKEEKEEEKDKTPVFPLDESMEAAGSLYAFEYESGKLVASKTGKEGPAPELTRKQLGGQGEEPKEALLDPRGMAVEPTTGNLVITGNQDEESNSKVESGAKKQCRAAAQFLTVTSIKSIALGARYVDSAGDVLFGQTGCGQREEAESINQAPASPTFAPDGSLLAYGEDASVGPEVEGIIWQFAPAGADTHAPGEVTTSPKELYVAESIPTFSPDIGEELAASVMSLVPENGTEGTIYLSGNYNVSKQPGPVVLRYHHNSNGEAAVYEVGWTAGGGTNENTGPEPCDLHKPRGEPIMLSGLSLSGSKRGYLALTYYYEYTGAHHENQVDRAEVVEFGEGGSTTECPVSTVTTPTQSLKGATTHEVPAGTTLDLTSVVGTIVDETAVPVAAAKSVTWKIKYTSPEDKTSEETVPPIEYEHNGLHEEGTTYGTVLSHEVDFAKPGKYEITDEVSTDDLAGEEAKPSAPDVVNVTSGVLSLKDDTPEPKEVFAHEEEAKLAVQAEVSGETKLHIKKVVWVFGDGTKQEETTEKEEPNPTTLYAKHVFGRCGEAKLTTCKVKVTVEAATKAGTQTKTAEPEIKVKENKAEEAAESKTTTTPTTTETTPTATGASTTQTSTQQTTTSSQPPPSGGVDAYIASFAGASLSVSASGATSITITCPAGGSCTGTLTLQTLRAVAASGKGKKKVLTLASGSFSLTAGSRSVTLHLSSAARALLSHDHGTLAAKLTLLSRGTGGQQNSTTSHVVALRLAKKSHKR